MADTRAFNVYFANRTALPGEVAIEGDTYLTLRGGTVYQIDAHADFGYASFSGGVDTTVTDTIDVWEPIIGTLIAGDVSASFGFAANQFTFNGVSQAVPSLLSGKLSLLRVTNGGDAYEVGVFVNDLLVGTGMTTNAENNVVGFVYTQNTHTLQTGDIIDMRVRNTTGTSSCIVTSAQLIIGG
jgi:hypothetical protein